MHHVVILGDRGHLEQHRGKYGHHQFYGHGNAQPLIDSVLQVRVVHKKRNDRGHRKGGRHPVDRMEVDGEIVVRVRYRHNTTPTNRIQAQQLLKLGSEHYDGHGTGEPADKRLREHGAQQP